MKDLIAKLDYITYQAARLGEKSAFGGDPEHDLKAATEYAVGQVLQLVAQLADITRDAITTLDQTASATARRQSATLNGMDADV